MKLQVVAATAFLWIGISGQTHASTIPTVFPAEISVTVNSTVDISSGVFFFSQSGTPTASSPHIIGVNPFQLSANTDEELSVVLSGNDPFGVYNTFSSQHFLFLGLYSEANTNNSFSVADAGTFGVVVLLPSGVGIGESFETVFPAYTEADVVTALQNLDSGDNSEDGLVQQGISYLFDFATSTLGTQAEWLPSTGSGPFTLESSQLVAFSDGTPVGSVVTSNYRIPDNGGPVVPEPTSLALAGFAGIGMAVGAWRRRRQEKLQAA